jgi:pyruvate dehydrogenase E2 component (dihydrolipoamide acetyltransferase)
VDVTMPQLGETVAEATVTRWLRRDGDQVRAGEPLFEVATDKVDTEIPAAADGILSEILVAEDRTVPVGTRVAVIRTAADAGPGTAAPPDPERGHGNGTAGPDLERSRSNGAASDHRLTPLVRRLLREHDLTADQVPGSGPAGRITRQDILAAADRRPRATSALATTESVTPNEPAAVAPTPVPPPRPAPAAAPAVPSPQAGPAARPAAPAISRTLLDQARVVPFSIVRRRTAEHMVASKAISPHTMMAIEVDYAQVDAVRGAAQAEWRRHEGTSLTYLPFIARAVIDAINAYPHLNASVGDNQLLIHGRVNLGVAVDLDGDGLVVPVIRDADGKRLRAIARQVADLARRARSAQLSPDDFAGGTFTISNPGPYGTLLTGAIINQPQVAILATDAVAPKPVAVPVTGGGYAVAVHPVGNLALTFDHRAIDGGYAARFLKQVKEILEHRDWTAEL